MNIFSLGYEQWIALLSQRATERGDYYKLSKHG
jgi:hypothetical protein